MIGGGLLLTTRASAAVRAFGLTLSTYGSFGLAIGLAGIVVEIYRPAGSDAAVSDPRDRRRGGGVGVRGRGHRRSAAGPRSQAFRSRWRWSWRRA